MIDIVDIQSTPWDKLAEKLKTSDQPIDKIEVLKAIKGDGALSDSAKLVLTALTEGDIPFKRGIKPHWLSILNPGWKKMIGNLLAGQVDRRAAELRATGSLRGEGGPRRMAKKEIAKANGISVSSLEKLMRHKDSDDVRRKNHFW